MFRFRVRVAPIFGEVNSLLTTCNSRRIILYRGDVGVLRCSELLEGLLRRHLCCNYVPHGQADLQGLGRSDLPHCLLYWHCFLEHPEFTIAALRAFILLPGIFKHSSACQAAYTKSTVAWKPFWLHFSLLRTGWDRAQNTLSTRFSGFSTGEYWSPAPLKNFLKHFFLKKMSGAVFLREFELENTLPTFKIFQ